MGRWKKRRVKFRKALQRTVNSTGDRWRGGEEGEGHHFVWSVLYTQLTLVSLVLPLFQRRIDSRSQADISEGPRMTFQDSDEPFLLSRPESPFPSPHVYLEGLWGRDTLGHTRRVKSDRPGLYWDLTVVLSSQRFLSRCSLFHGLRDLVLYDQWKKKQFGYSKTPNR